MEFLWSISILNDSLKRLVKGEIILKKLKEKIIRGKYYIYTVFIMIAILIIGLLISSFGSEGNSPFSLIRIVLGLGFIWGTYILGYQKYVKKRPNEYNLVEPYFRCFFIQFIIWFNILFDIFLLLLFVTCSILSLKPTLLIIGIMCLPILIGMQWILYKFLRVFQ